MTDWTDHRVEQLKSLWTEGLSPEEIASVLGGVTRNAVVGKAYRVGLTGKALPDRSVRPRISLVPKVPMRKHERSPEPLVVEEEPITLDDGTFATVLTISDHMCRWPIGDPGEEDFHFCGLRPKKPFPYCETHVRKAYQPQQLRNEKKRKA